VSRYRGVFPWNKSLHYDQMHCRINSTSAPKKPSPEEKEDWALCADGSWCLLWNGSWVQIIVDSDRELPIPPTTSPTTVKRLSEKPLRRFRFFGDHFKRLKNWFTSLAAT
jgi:hypothetical protein